MQANNLAEAVSVLKGDVDLIAKAISILKADPGEEPGEFRGGDPQELQEKKELKRQEMADSGELDQRKEEQELEIEEAGGQSAWDEDQAEQEEMKRAMGTVSSAEVSPVEHSEEGYRPRNANGDPIEPTKKKDLPPNIEPAPTRTDKQRHESTWSKFLGMEVPLEGAYWQYMRTLRIRNQEGGAIREYDKFLKSFMDEYEDAFFRVYDILNGGLCFDVDHRIVKGGHEKGWVKPGHKYIYRSMGEDGTWQYQYTVGAHPSHHGVEHTGSVQGHTIAVHSEWHGKGKEGYAHGKDPNLKNPEEAFHFTRKKIFARGGKFKFKTIDKDTLKNREKTLVIAPHKFDARSKAKPATDRPFTLKDHVPKGSDEKKHSDKRFKNVEAFENHMRRSEVHVEKDIHGNPWIQWHAPPVKTEEQLKKEKELKAKGEKVRKPAVKMRYMKDSPYARKVGTGEGKNKADVGEFFYGPESIAGLRKRVRKELHVQKHTAEQTKPWKFEPTGRKTVDMLQSGAIPGKYKEVPYMDPGYHGNVPSTKRKGTRLALEREWESQDQHNKVTGALYSEYKDEVNNIVDGVKERINKDLVKAGKTPLPSLSTREIEEEFRKVMLPYVTFALWKASDSYDPSYTVTHRKTGKETGVQFYTHMQNHLMSLMRSNLYNIHLEVFGQVSGLSEKDYKKYILGEYESKDKANKALPESGPESIEAWGTRVVDHLINHTEQGPKHAHATDHEKEHHQDLVQAAAKDLKQVVGRGHEHGPADFYVKWTDPLRGGYGFVPPYGFGEDYGAGELSKAQEEGKPQREGEVSAETNPEFFHEDGNMLNQPIPEGVEAESNPEYDPDKKQGNFWAKRYMDPGTGDQNYVYYHHDQVNDPRYSRNNSLRHVAEQLPKIRQWYVELAQAESPHDQAVSLFLALCDLASLPGDILATYLTLDKVNLGDGNVIKFKMTGGEISVILDEVLTPIFQSLLQDKESSDYVFAIDRHILDIGTLNQHMQEVFGVSLEDLHVYRCTYIFSMEFQKLIIQEKDELTDNIIQNLRQDALRKVAEFTGQTLGDVDKMVDPIAVEACVLSSSTGQHKVLKAVDTLSEKPCRLQMIKSQVWVVGVSEQHVDSSEEQFNQWVHSYPLHEHEKHWEALTRRHAQEDDRKREVGNPDIDPESSITTPPEEEELAS